MRATQQRPTPATPGSWWPSSCSSTTRPKGLQRAPMPDCHQHRASVQPGDYAPLHRRGGVPSEQGAVGAVAARATEGWRRVPAGADRGAPQGHGRAGRWLLVLRIYNRPEIGRNELERYFTGGDETSTILCRGCQTSTPRGSTSSCSAAWTSAARTRCSCYGSCSGTTSGHRTATWPRREGGGGGSTSSSRCHSL